MWIEVTHCDGWGNFGRKTCIVSQSLSIDIKDKQVGVIVLDINKTMTYYLLSNRYRWTHFIHNHHHGTVSMFRGFPARRCNTKCGFGELNVVHIVNILVKLGALVCTHCNIFSFPFISPEFRFSQPSFGTKYQISDLCF